MKPRTRSKSLAGLRRFIPLAITLLLAAACDKVQPNTPPLFPAADFSLTVLHTNDVHSAYGGLTDKGLICYAARCEGGRGGYVRLDQAVRAIRKDNPDALFLDAGDIFQGTLSGSGIRSACPRPWWTGWAIRRSFPAITSSTRAGRPGSAMRTA